MLKTIISDASCLILLDKIGELNILEKLYGEVIITSIIAEEFGLELPLWIKVNDPQNIDFQNNLLSFMDIGEASAIALAVESGHCKLILDDEKARKKVIELGLDFTGTLGVLSAAKIRGIIPLLKPMFDKIELTDFHYINELLKRILKSVGE
jgi:predicted nucleic acid-binding protein